MNRIIVTGANGFVGRQVITTLDNQGYDVIGGVRAAPRKGQLILDLNSEQDISDALKGVDCIVHCAARVHQMSDTATDPYTEYFQVNCAGTLALARSAAKAGVKRFIFLSTSKVCGEMSHPGFPLVWSSQETEPTEPYARSKYHAEQALRMLASESGMEVVILRPPLVYGPGVKANFAALINLVKKGIPLPLGAINNARSMIYIGNLVDCISTCMRHPKAANQTFLLSDDDDISTTELLMRLGKSMQKQVRLLPVPQNWLLGVTRLLGKTQIGERLCSSLQLDISYVKERLNWRPPYTMEQGLSEMMREQVNE